MSDFPKILFHPNITAQVTVRNSDEEKEWTNQGWVKTKPKDLPTPPDSILYDSLPDDAVTDAPNVSPAAPVTQVSDSEPVKKTK